MSSFPSTTQQTHKLEFPTFASIASVSEVSHLAFVRLDRRVLAFDDDPMMMGSHYHSHNSNAELEHPDHECQYLLSSHYDGTICCWQIYGGDSLQSLVRSHFLFQFKTTNDVCEEEEEEGGTSIGVLYFTCDPESGAIYSANTDGTIRQHFPFRALKKYKRNLIQSAQQEGNIQSNSSSFFTMHHSSSTAFSNGDRDHQMMTNHFIQEDQTDFMTISTLDVNDELIVGSMDQTQDLVETTDTSSLTQHAFAEKQIFTQYSNNHQNKQILSKKNILTVSNKIIGAHADAVNHIFFVQEEQCIISTGWDGYVKIWDLLESDQDKTLLLEINLHGCITAMDIKYPLMIVSSQPRNIVLFDLHQPNVPVRSWKSVLKSETQKHCLKLFPDRLGFAYSTVEGRCSISHIDPTFASSNFIFKCHRTAQDVFPPNSIDFNPSYGTFSTTGGML